MNDLQIFSSPEFGQVRTVEIDGTPWLVGKDVAVALGYKNPTKAIIAHVDDEDKRLEMLPQEAEAQNGTLPSGSTKTALINESGLYSLILSSKMPKAKVWISFETYFAWCNRKFIILEKPCENVFSHYLTVVLLYKHLQLAFQLLFLLYYNIRWKPRLPGFLIV